VQSRPPPLRQRMVIRVRLPAQRSSDSSATIFPSRTMATRSQRCSTSAERVAGEKDCRSLAGLLAKTSSKLILHQRIERSGGFI